MFTNKDNMKRQLNNSPKYMILADINSKKYIRSFNLTYGEIVYGKIKKIAPCGKNSFQTLNSKIIFPENVIYFFGGKYYKFSEKSFKEINEGEIIGSEDIKVLRKCKYKIKFVVFYDYITHLISEEYVVIPR